MNVIAICLMAPGVALILSDEIAAKNGIDLYGLSTLPSGIPCTMGFLLTSGGFTLKGGVLLSLVHLSSH
jgi:hypothetical protein